jgi:hypothetical protein
VAPPGYKDRRVVIRAVDKGYGLPQSARQTARPSAPQVVTAGNTTWNTSGKYSLEYKWKIQLGINQLLEHSLEYKWKNTAWKYNLNTVWKIQLGKYCLEYHS